MPLQAGLSVERMCELARVSRAGFYRWLQVPRSVEEEMELRALIQQIAMEHRRRYGYRRISNPPRSDDFCELADKPRGAIAPILVGGHQIRAVFNPSP